MFIIIGIYLTGECSLRAAKWIVFLADRQPQKPFAVESAPPLSGGYLNKSQVVIRSGAQRFGHSRKSIEHALHKFLAA
jgi:hypothetical protein